MFMYSVVISQVDGNFMIAGRYWSICYQLATDFLCGASMKVCQQLSSQNYHLNSTQSKTLFPFVSCRPIVPSMVECILSLLDPNRYRSISIQSSLRSRRLNTSLGNFFMHFSL